MSAENNTKRSQLQDKRNLATRIAEARDAVPHENLKTFAHYSVEYLKSA